MIQRLLLSLAVTAAMAAPAVAAAPQGLANKAAKEVVYTGRSDRPRHVGSRSDNGLDMSLVRPARKTGPFAHSYSFRTPQVYPSPLRVNAPAAESAPIRATVLFSNQWTGGIAQYGLYEFSTDKKPQSAKLIKEGNINWYAIAGATYAGPYYYTANSSEDYMGTVISCSVITPAHGSSINTTTATKTTIRCSPSTWPTT